MKNINKKNVKTNQKKNSSAGFNFNIDSLYFSFGSLMIIFLGYLVYSNSFHCEMAFDDRLWYQVPELLTLDLKRIFDFSHLRFLPLLTLSLNYNYSQFDVYNYHVVNLIIHLLTSLSSWFLLQAIFKTQAIKDSNIAKYSKIIALIGALIFVSHPIQTQAVTYIYQRLASFVALFYISTLMFYINGRLSETPAKRLLFFALSGFTALCGFFSKENAFTLPLMIFLIEFILLKKDVKFNPKVIYGLLGIFLLSIF